LAVSIETVIETCDNLYNVLSVAWLSDSELLPKIVASTWCWRFSLLCGGWWSYQHHPWT